ncbi:unnamed protein product, partial [Nesidiocoris tenuis]
IMVVVRHHVRPCHTRGARLVNSQQTRIVILSLFLTWPNCTLTSAPRFKASTRRSKQGQGETLPT